MLSNQKRVNVSINPETMELLTIERSKLAEILGFTPSYSQVIQHIIKSAQTKTQS
jgi:hypothetical protein